MKRGERVDTTGRRGGERRGVEVRGEGGEREREREEEEERR